MPKSPTPSVSKTAVWMAIFRAMETERPDALFRDPLARRLAGEGSRGIARILKWLRGPAWSVVIRTHIIDTFVRDLVAQGVDTVVNLGAGLDARPYRLELPSTLRWIEVDFSNVIKLKEERLRGEIPRCRLERLELDLSDTAARARVFSEIAATSRKVLVLTEGVTPYFTAEQVAALAADLRAHEPFRFWVVDCLSSEALRHARRGAILRVLLKGTPVRFAPDDWLDFFAQRGWKAEATHRLDDASRNAGRPVPGTPFRSASYVLLVPKPT